MKKKIQKRKVFGFLCSPGLKWTVLFIAKKLGVTNSGLMEHIVQLGFAQVYASLEDKEFREELVNHIIQDHQLQPAIDVESDYDRHVLVKAEKEMEGFLQEEKAVRFCVAILKHERIHPKYLLRATAHLVMKVREARRRKR